MDEEMYVDMTSILAIYKLLVAQVEFTIALGAGG